MDKIINQLIYRSVSTCLPITRQPWHFTGRKTQTLTLASLAGQILS